MKSAPLLYALILFLLIRIINDIPSGLNYFSHSVQFIAIEVAGVIAGSYLNFYFAGQWMEFCRKKKIGNIVEYAVVCMVPCALAVGIMSMSHDTPLLSEAVEMIIPFTVTVLITVWMYLALKNHVLNRLYTETLLKEEKSRHAKSALELQLLRNQFHPHFLFNMLNTIYFAVDDNNEEARDAIEHLSKLLRSQLSNDDKPVTLNREAALLDSYIALYRLRYKDDVDIRVDIDHSYGEDLIHPHLLQPLVENAFKHLGGRPARVTIALQRPNRALIFRVENTVTTTPERTESRLQKSGFGLENLKKLLALQYADCHKLEIERTATHCTAKLTLAL
ncbi:MAG: histidine kinase [Bacteroidales bacterium]|nr:histidine kinase [Bacteroidales bacterium]